MDVVLVSTYDLGRQPTGLASPAAWLREAGHEVHQVDVSRGPLSMDLVRAAGLVAFFLPMHTATRLALPLVRRVRASAPSATIAAYGLYAPINAESLHEAGVSAVIGPECEAQLCELAAGRAPTAERVIPRLQLRVPDRRGLPPLDKYARLRSSAGDRVAGYTEASRGCKHRCRHCPIVPVYDGTFRLVAVEVVLADIAQQVAAGATHVTFGDPDFLNGPKHALAVVDALASRCPGVSYDVTVKVEHLVAHAALLPRLRETGCVLVTSAFESFDDRVLRALAKGHTAEDAVRAVTLCRQAGLVLAPTFVAFTPWTTKASYGDLLRTIAALDLVEQVAPIQLALRLLVTSGSRLLELPDLRALVGPYDRARLVHPWAHPDPEVDALQRDVEATVARLHAPARAEAFAAVVATAEHAGVSVAGAPVAPGRTRVEVPYLDEPWYC